MPEFFHIGGETFPLIRKQVAVGGREISLAGLPYTPDWLEKVVAARAPGERNWPYWLEDWPATYALAEVLAGEDASAWRLPVLDLGCGSGFLASFLRLRFGLRPYCCDFNFDACRLAAMNLGLQGGPAFPSRVVCADMESFPLRGPFGLILAGEMLYARENQARLLTFLKGLLAPGGAAYLADPGRSAAEGFAAAAAARGFRVRILERTIPEGNRKVQVYQVDRPGEAV